MVEIESTLKWFKKDKSPCPDGWFVEFYLAFFETIGQDLIKVVEICKSVRRTYEATNSTLIALIPKVDSLLPFNDIRPISIYNGLYKITSKIIANRLNPILSAHISTEKF